MGQNSSTCRICYEPGRCLACDDEHSFCKHCMSMYVRSCCENVGKLKDDGFVITCPEVNCGYHWNPKALKPSVSKKVYQLLKQTLDNRFQSPMEKLSIPLSLTNAVIDSLNVACPNCNSVLDQTPDGCCALRCNRCAVYFCWLCFTLCPTSSLCHFHVTECKHNSSGEPFVPRRDVEVAHRLYKIQKIRGTLQSHFESTRPAQVASDAQVSDIDTSHATVEEDGGELDKSAPSTVERATDCTDWLHDGFAQCVLEEVRAALEMNGITPEEVLGEVALKRKW